eukprot:3809586-Rhodomonas_salina.1
MIAWYARQGASALLAPTRQRHATQALSQPLPSLASATGARLARTRTNTALQPAKAAQQVTTAQQGHQRRCHARRAVGRTSRWQ